MKHEAFSHEIYPNGFVRLASRKSVFIRHRGKWEFYRVEQSGESRGLEMFAGYVERPDQIALLERAVRVAWRMGGRENQVLPNHSRWETKEHAP